MKKTKMIFGLVFATSLLASCGSKGGSSETKPVVPNTPDRGDLTFNVEFKETYTDSRYVDAKNNLLDKLTSGISSVNAEMAEYYNDPSIYSYNMSAKGTFDFYSNGVAITSVDMCEETIVGDSSVVSPGGNKFVETYVATEDALLCREEQYSPFSEDISYSVHEPLVSDIAEVAEFDYLFESSGMFGKDAQGRNLYYFIDYNQSSEYGYDKYGNSISVYDFNIMEILVVFSGSVFTGNISTVYSVESRVKYYDDNYVYSEEPILKQQTSVKYDFKYGARKEYKNKDALVESFYEPSWIKTPTISIVGCPATLNTEKTAFETIGSVNVISGADVFHSRAEKPINIYEGSYEFDSFYIREGVVAFPVAEIDCEYLVKQSDGSISVQNETTYMPFTFEFNEEDLPDGLLLIDDPNIDQLGFYAEKDVSLSRMIGSFTIELSLNETGTSSEGVMNATVTFPVL